MPKLIAANWKENPRTEMQALALFRAVASIKVPRGAEVAVCPPFIYLEKIAEVRRREKKQQVALGAQDVFWEEKGPFTSEVGPAMLRSLGVGYVIIGHSERRKWLKETDKMINKKIQLALKDGLRVILCVGESLAVRRKGVAVAERFVESQLRKDLVGIRGVSARLAIAYEPIWAIGTGRYDRPEDAARMADHIRSFLKKTFHLVPRVLYGGSVSSKNAGRYVSYKGIDGALVGGASLAADEFKKIVAAASGPSVK